MDNTRATSREQLLREAERLFGTHGVDAVSLRDIVRAAGHKNESAVQYHFGSKQDLVDAVVWTRLTRIEVARAAMLKELAAAGKSEDAFELARAIVEPLADEVLDAPGGHDYVRFLAQAITRPGFDIVRFVDRLDLEGMVGVTRQLRRIAGRVPPSVQRMRERMAIASMVTGLAAWVADPSGISRQRLLQDLTRVVAAIVAPPPSN